jgi:phosphoglycerate dehydrogenase-like enzyme
MARIAVLDDYQNVAMDYADWPFAGNEIIFFHDPLDAPAAQLEPFEIVCAMRERTAFPAEVFDRLPNLRLLVTTGMRNAAIDMDAAAAHGVTVCGTEVPSTPTAELTWGLVLALARHLPVEDAGMRGGGWQTTVGVDLTGKTLGVVGLGRLGSIVTRYGAAFGMRPIAWSENLTAERAAECGAELVAKDELFSTADVVTIHLVLSRRTRGLIGAHELGLMKPTAFLVNTTRGPVVDEAALVRALEEGTIAGAALDVFEREPEVAEGLLALENVVLTPHLGSATLETREAMGMLCVEALRAVLLEGRVPANALNPEAFR